VAGLFDARWTMMPWLGGGAGAKDGGGGLQRRMRWSRISREGGRSGR
jgi:hypothetical protein